MGNLKNELLRTVAMNKENVSEITHDSTLDRIRNIRGWQKRSKNSYSRVINLPGFFHFLGTREIGQKPGNSREFLVVHFPCFWLRNR